MGRRKIEIQPITHERNRSVTFLKRKNGLFKKAYELGVLCSVDVAVIIFEERPGHHVKLYQYCSTDIHDMVQRHLRHDGEKDTRGPGDFSGNANNKHDDLADNDEDEGDDDEDDPRRAKRGRDGKPKPNSDLVNGLDYGHGHRTLAIPQPPNLSIHGAGSTLPISDDRTRRNRLGSLHSRSPSDELANGYSYHHPSQNSGPFGGQNQYGAPRHSGSQYQPFFPVSHTSSSPSSFMPSLQSDFHRGPNASSRNGSGGGYPLPPRSNSSNSSSYDPGMYSSMISSRTGSAQTNGGGGDLFAAFMDPSEQSRPQTASSQQGSGFVGLDWPVHAPGAGHGASGGSAASVNTSSTSEQTNGTTSNGHWLDFLSGNPTNQSATNGRETMSWERGGGGNGMFTGDRGRTVTSSSPMISVGGMKRTRLEDELLPPPLTTGRAENGDSTG